MVESVQSKIKTWPNKKAAGFKKRPRNLKSDQENGTIWNSDGGEAQKHTQQSPVVLQEGGGSNNGGRKKGEKKAV